MYCLDRYFKCFKKNRCHMEKLQKLKQICDRNYTECMEFSKKMCDKIEAKDFLARKHLNIDDQ